MRRSLLSLVFTSLAIAWGQVPTQGERDRALSLLHGSHKELSDSVIGLTAAQWKFKPAPEAWSVEEVVEHLVLVETALFQLASVDAMKTPDASDAQKAEVRPKTDIILKVIPERAQKVQTREQFKPSGKYKTPAEGLAAFKEVRTKTITFTRETPLPLHDHILPHPALGPMDAYQWIMFIGAHTERHANQIREVKANPGFPKGQ